jgi:hypothetical protein
MVKAADNSLICLDDFGKFYLYITLKNLINTVTLHAIKWGTVS